MKPEASRSSSTTPSPMRSEQHDRSVEQRWSGVSPVGAILACTCAECLRRSPIKGGESSLAAKCRGDGPPPAGIRFGAAWARRSSSAAASLPCSVARCNAVYPWAFGRSASSEFPSRIESGTAEPSVASWCISVLPFCTKLLEAPRSLSALAAPACSPSTAQSRGDLPSSSLVFCAAPRCARKEHACASPALAAACRRVPPMVPPGGCSDAPASSSKSQITQL